MAGDAENSVVDVTPQIEQAKAQAQAGDVAGAVEALLAVERVRRKAEDEAAVKGLVDAVVEVTWAAQDVALLNSTVLLLAKRRAQFPQAIVKMVNKVMGFLDEDGVSSEDCEAMLDTLLVVCTGKIFVEVQRARLTLRKAKAKAAGGETKAAAELLHEIQIETLGSMDKDEKINFILEQMRMCLEAGDWLRVLIISRKIHAKVFAGGKFQEEKVKYHDLLVAYHMHESNFLHVARSLLAVYNTPLILESADAAWRDYLAKAAVFIMLSKQAPDQQDLLHRIRKEKNLADLSGVFDMVAAFTTPEIMVWPEVQGAFTDTLAALPGGYFDASEDGAARVAEMKQRVIEHNIRVISKYYSRISLGRLASLLDLDPAAAESVLCDMVVEGVIYAKIDRLADTITFTKPVSADEILNDWASDVASLLSIVEKCDQNMQKEFMMHAKKK